MARPFFLQTALLLATLLLGGCVHPISEQAREQVDEKTTFAMVSDNPSAFLDQHLVLGGSVVSIESTDDGNILEIMEWRLNRWGEPLYLDDSGRRFLAKTSEPVDTARYEPGTLVTLVGVVLGNQTRLLGEHEYDYPVFGTTELHLWESPFRYGIHSSPNPAYPYFVDQDKDPHKHPYDSGYNPYPYTQYWYRGNMPPR